jgi:hypothetical protein
VVSSHGDRSDAAGIARCLEPYQSAFERQFKMLPPANTVTVYVADHVGEVIAFAAALHGVALPRGTIAYSVAQDLSMVGIATPMSCGSLAHELFHLMIRRNFGNSPAWLEEGLASAVAVVLPRAGSFRFASSWRDDVLGRLWSKRPTVPELLAMDWTAYSADRDARFDDVAVRHAMAPVFVRYLAEQRALERIYFAIRDGGFSADMSTRTAASDIVSRALGKTLDTVDADFARWFREQHPIRSVPAVHGAGTSNTAQGTPQGAVNQMSPQENADMPNAPSMPTPNMPATPDVPRNGIPGTPDVPHAPDAPDAPSTPGHHVPDAPATQPPTGARSSGRPQ